MYKCKKHIIPEILLLNEPKEEKLQNQRMIRI